MPTVYWQRQNASLKWMPGCLRVVFIRTCIQDLEFQCVCFPNGSKALQLCQKWFDIQILALYSTSCIECTKQGQPLLYWGFWKLPRPSLPSNKT